MPLQFVGPALQGASFIGRVGIPLLQQAGLAAGMAGIGAGVSGLTNKPQQKTGRQKLTQTWGTISDNLNSFEGGGFGYKKGKQPIYKDAQGNTYDAVSGRLLYPARKPTQQPTQQTFDVPAGTFQSGSVVTGLTPDGKVDLTKGDEYKAQLAQYQGLINDKKVQEAEDLGMKIWMQKYGNTPMGQAGGVIGAKNPLLAERFPETGGYASTFTPVEEYQMGDLGTRAQGEMGPTMETLNPMAAQAQQQAATAAQADKATTAGVKIPIRNRVQAFLYGGM